MSVLKSLSRLWRFHGGLHLPEHKTPSTQQPIAPLPLASEFVLPLQQHIGAPARAAVTVGQTVAKGEVLARADGYLSVPLHAPTSGTVLAIEPRLNAAWPSAALRGLHIDPAKLGPSGTGTLRRLTGQGTALFILHATTARTRIITSRLRRGSHRRRLAVQLLHLLDLKIHERRIERKTQVLQEAAREVQRLGLQPREPHRNRHHRREVIMRAQEIGRHHCNRRRGKLCRDLASFWKS